MLHQAGTGRVQVAGAAGEGGRKRHSGVAVKDPWVACRAVRLGYCLDRWHDG